MRKKNFRCDYCGKICKSERGLKRHKNASGHMSEPPTGKDCTETLIGIINLLLNELTR